MPESPSLIQEEAPKQESPVAQVRERFLKEELDKLGTAEPEEETPAAEEEQPEEEEQPAEPETPELPENWETAEAAAERIKAAQDEGYNKAKSHLTRAHNATLEELEESHAAEIQNAEKRAVSYQVVQQLAETIESLDAEDPASVRAVTKWLQSNGDWAKVFLGNQDREAQQSLVHLVTTNERWTEGITGEAADEFNATIKELGLKLRTRVARSSTPEEVRKSYADALNSYLEERDKRRDKIIIDAAIAKEQKRLESVARKAAGLTDKAEQRRNNAPPAKPAGAAGAGAKTIEEEKAILRDPSSPIQLVKEIRDRHKKAGIA